MYFCAYVVVLHRQLYSLIINYFLNERNLESTMNVKDYVNKSLVWFHWSSPHALRKSNVSLPFLPSASFLEITTAVCYNRHHVR